jgi:hypothetical protein
MCDEGIHRGKVQLANDGSTLRLHLAACQPGTELWTKELTLYSRAGPICSSRRILPAFLSIPGHTPIALSSPLQHSRLSSCLLPQHASLLRHSWHQSLQRLPNMLSRIDRQLPGVLDAGIPSRAGVGLKGKETAGVPRSIRPVQAERQL